MDPDNDTKTNLFHAFFTRESDPFSIVMTALVVGTFGVVGLVNGFNGDPKGFEIAFWAGIIELGVVAYTIAFLSYLRRHRD